MDMANELENLEKEYLRNLAEDCDGYFTHPFEFPSNGDARRKRPGNHGETPWMSQVTRG
jgi:hypothetical protein